MRQFSKAPNPWMPSVFRQDTLKGNASCTSIKGANRGFVVTQPGFDKKPCLERAVQVFPRIPFAEATTFRAGGLSIWHLCGLCSF